MLPMMLTIVFPDYDKISGQPIEQKIHYGLHFSHIVIFLMGAGFFAFDFPQRYFPGKLDFFGQGHNIFHLCIFVVVYLQLDACYLDYIANRELIASTRPPPTFSYCFISLFCLVIYYVYLIVLFTKMIEHNFDAEGNLIHKNQHKQSENVQKTTKRDNQQSAKTE
jgi:predicted membrane channel-forming protein YqfA (hemolysin III family)